MRHDIPETNPRLRIDALPSQGRRVVVSNDPRPRPAAKQKADTAPAPKRTKLDDAKDRTAARRDAALAGIRGQHKTARRGFNRDDLRQGPTKADAQPTPGTTAADAAEAIRNAHRRK